jgi:hypothetical protein
MPVVEGFDWSSSTEPRIGAEHPRLHRGYPHARRKDLEDQVKINELRVGRVVGLTLSARISPDRLWVAVSHGERYELLAEGVLECCRYLGGVAIEQLLVRRLECVLNCHRVLSVRRRLYAIWFAFGPYIGSVMAPH